MPVVMIRLRGELAENAGVLLLLRLVSLGDGGVESTLAFGHQSAASQDER